MEAVILSEEIGVVRGQVVIGGAEFGECPQPLSLEVGYMGRTSDTGDTESKRQPSHEEQENRHSVIAARRPQARARAALSYPSLHQNCHECLFRGMKCSFSRSIIVE